MITRGAEVQCQRGSLEVQVKSELVFIGIQMFFKGSAVMMSQQRWVVKQLNIRGYLHLKGTPCLPQVEEGKYSKGSEDQCNPTLIKKALREMGALMWLATKTRPDIASTCGILSTLVVLRPDLVLAKATSLWKYVRHTMFYGMTFRNSDDRTLALESDASFGSGASRSRSGYAIKWGPNVIMYKSSRQSLTAYSTCEAETCAMADAIADQLRMEYFVLQVGSVESCQAGGDNAASLAALAKPRFHEMLWRTRHFGLRASWIRDTSRQHEITLNHKAGSELAADLLTKSLSRVKLEQFRPMLGVIRAHDA